MQVRTRINRASLGIAAAVVASAHGLRAGEALKQIVTRGGVEMLEVPAGEFRMGSRRGEVDEKPAHTVRVSGFCMDVTPVTQQEYARLMGDHPSKWKNPANPVDMVRWSDCVTYCNRRSREEGLEECYDLETWTCDFSRSGYRLPTEAEWEYACRAGTKTEYFFGAKASRLQIYAWYKRNSGRHPRPTGRKLANPWGFRDLYGNVAEWINDFYQADYYASSPTSNPRGPATGEAKVVRGGSWASRPDACRSASRSNEDPSYVDACFGYDVYGFRCVRSTGEE